MTRKKRSLAETKGEVNMSKAKLQAMVEELVSLREMAAEPADEIAAIEDALKADMRKQGVDTVEAGKHTVRYAVVKSSRFDAKAFQAAYPSIYGQYTRATEYRRFTVQ